MPSEGAWAWASGHVSATICVAAALTAYYPERLWIPPWVIRYWSCHGFGMIDGDYHWGWDVLAVALFGHVLGLSAR